MNVDPLIKWGIDKLFLVDNFDKFSCLDCPKEYLLEKLGWLADFRNTLDEWKEIIHIVKGTETFIRYPRDIPTFTTQNIRAMQIKEELLGFFEQESAKAGKDERLLGRSEIIESVFGKMKLLEHHQPKGGFTVFILSLAAIVSETTTEVFHKALETVPTKKIHKWLKDNIGESVQAKRAQINKLIKKEEQKQNQIIAA